MTARASGFSGSRMSDRRAGLTAVPGGTDPNPDGTPDPRTAVAPAFSALPLIRAGICITSRMSWCHNTEHCFYSLPSTLLFFLLFFPILPMLLLFSCLASWSLFLVVLTFHFCCCCSAKLLPCPHLSLYRAVKVEKHPCLRCLTGHFSVCAARQVLFGGYLKTKVVKIC